MHNFNTIQFARICIPAFVMLAVSPQQLSPRPWPGTGVAQTVDSPASFAENLSGLAYEKEVLWGVQNRPGKLFRLSSDGSRWALDASDEWKNGRTLRYKNGGGDPDAEGITFAGAGSSAGVYVSTERDNDSNSRSRNSILRFDPSQSGAELRATHEWDITADLPRTGANEGIEAIAWVPDSYLVARRFHDESANKAYSPADYPGHGNGLFFVGVEGDGQVFAFALNHDNGTFKRIAALRSGLPQIMVLEFDRELNILWAVCDNNCGTRAAVLEISEATTGAAAGRFAVTRIFERPSSLPNVNNEGFAVATQSQCKNGQKPAYWSDDSDTGGHSIRSASVPCAPF